MRKDKRCPKTLIVQCALVKKCGHLGFLLIAEYLTVDCPACRAICICSDEEECVYCNGTGKSFVLSSCIFCNGKGRVKINK